MKRIIQIVAFVFATALSAGDFAISPDALVRVINSDWVEACGFAVSNDGIVVSSSRISEGKNGKDLSFVVVRSENAETTVYPAKFLGKGEEGLALFKVSGFACAEPLKLAKDSPKSGDALAVAEFSAYCKRYWNFSNFSRELKIRTKKTDLQDAEKLETFLFMVSGRDSLQLADAMRKERSSQILARMYSRVLKPHFDSMKFPVPLSRQSRLTDARARFVPFLEDLQNGTFLYGGAEPAQDGAPILDSSGCIVAVALDSLSSAKGAGALAKAGLAKFLTENELHFETASTPAEAVSYGSIQEEIAKKKALEAKAKSFEGDLWRKSVHLFSDIIEFVNPDDDPLAHYIVFVILALLVCLPIVLVFARRAGRLRAMRAIPKMKMSPTRVSRVDEFSASFALENDKSLSEAERVVGRIRLILSGRGDDIEIFSAARDFVKIRSEASARLAKCAALFSAGAIAESREIAFERPNLVNLINTLQFAELQNWSNFCKNFGAPAPDPISDRLIMTINAISARENSADILQELAKLSSQGKFLDAINLAERGLLSDNKNAELKARLAELQSSYLSSEISRIDAFARAGEHSEAVFAYLKLKDVIPEDVCRKNPEWENLCNYAELMRKSHAKLSLEKYSASLRVTNPEDWRKVYAILADARSTLAQFPDLLENFDASLAEKMRDLAEDAKAREAKKTEFDKVCAKLSAEMSLLSDRADSSLSVRHLRLRLNEIERLWRAVKMSDFTPDAQLVESFESAKTKVKRAIRRGLILKRTVLGMLLCVVLLAFVFVSHIGYDEFRRRRAYSEYAELRDASVSEQVIRQTLSRLNSRNSKYLERAEFVKIRTMIKQKITDASSLEKAFAKYESAVSGLPAELASLKTGAEVKARETELETARAYLEKNLPKEFENRLNVATANSRAAFGSYATTAAEKFSQKRADEFEKTQKLFANLESKLRDGKFDKNLEKSARLALAKLKLSSDPYAPPPSQAELSALAELQEKLDKISNFVTQTKELIAKLDSSADLTSYIATLERMRDLRASEGVTGETYADIERILASTDSLANFCVDFYANQSSSNRRLSAKLGELGKNELFGTISDPSAISADIGRLCSPQARAIYTHTLNTFNKSALASSSSRIFTIFKPEQIAEKKDFKFYEGKPITSCEDITFTYTPISEFASLTPRVRTCTVREVKCLGENGTEIFKMGESLEDTTLSAESARLNRLANRIYNDEYAELRTDCVLLSELETILADNLLDVNFRISTAWGLLRAMSDKSPYASGFAYSPSAQKVLSSFEKNPSDKAIKDALSWIKSPELISRISKIFESRPDATNAGLMSALKKEDSSLRFFTANADGKILQAESADSSGIYIGFDAESKVVVWRGLENVRAKPMSLVARKNSTDVLEPSADALQSLRGFDFATEARFCAALLEKLNSPRTALAGFVRPNKSIHLNANPNKGSYLAYIAPDGIVAITDSLKDINAAPFSPIVIISAIEQLRDEAAAKMGVNSSSEIVKTVMDFIFDMPRPAQK